MEQTEALKFAFVTALKYLKTGYKPSGKIKEKLISKGCSPEVVATALAVLEKKNYIKDDVLATLYVEEGLASGRIVESFHFLQQRLRNLGYRKSAIEEALALYDSDKALQNFLETKVFREWQNLKEDALKESISLYEHEDFKFILKKAVSKGFSFSQVRQKIEEDLRKERESFEE